MCRGVSRIGVGDSGTRLLSISELCLHPSKDCRQGNSRRLFQTLSGSHSRYWIGEFTAESRAAGFCQDVLLSVHRTAMPAFLGLSPAGFRVTDCNPLLCGMSTQAARAGDVFVWCPEFGGFLKTAKAKNARNRYSKPLNGMQPALFMGPSFRLHWRSVTFSLPGELRCCEFPD